MHVHGMCGMQMSKRTSLARPQRGAKSPATVTADAAVRSRTPAVEPLPSVAKAVSVGPPARVRSGRLGCPRPARQQRSRRAVAAHVQPVRLRERREHVHTGQGRCERKAGALWRWLE